jgi:hypothetical protein
MNLSKKKRITMKEIFLTRQSFYSQNLNIIIELKKFLKNTSVEFQAFSEESSWKTTSVA